MSKNPKDLKKAPSKDSAILGQIQNLEAEAKGYESRGNPGMAAIIRGQIVSLRDQLQTPIRRPGGI